MRLDHLLSKENRVFVLSLGWVLVSTWWWQVFVIVWCLVWARSGGKFLFSGEDKYRMHVLCVVWELMRQRFFAVFQPLLVVKGFAE